MRVRVRESFPFSALLGLILDMVENSIAKCIEVLLERNSSGGFNATQLVGLTNEVNRFTSQTHFIL